ncbi:MAG: terminal dioxygenase small subunit [Conexibacter sp.]|nr:terminal dioxygenase small subunit [Conexibacter sp.]
MTDPDPADFLVREAEHLDNNELREWLEGCVTEDISYQIPIRITRERGAATDTSDGGWLMNEDWHSLHMRIERLYTAYAWAEDPASRTRRFVTNFRLNPTETEGVVEIKSNILLFQGRYDTAGHFLAGERHDLLRLVDGAWRLAHRRVLLDHTTLDIPALSVLL